MLDTSDLDELLKWMRENRVFKARLGDLELAAELPMEYPPDSGLDNPMTSRRGESESMYTDRDLWNGEPPEAIRRALPKPSEDEDEAGNAT